MDSTVKSNGITIQSITFCLIVFGWICCGYLVYRSTLLTNLNGSGLDFCKLLFGASCDTALATRISWHLGFPLGGVGMAYFGLLGVLFFVRKRLIDRSLIYLSAFSVGISIILSYIIIKGQLDCPLCLLVHLVNLVLFICLLWLNRFPQATMQGNPVSKGRRKLNLVIPLLILIILGGFTEIKLLKSSFEAQPNVHPDEIVEAFQHTKAYVFPSSNITPRIGTGEEAIQLVVFSSFQCPACKGFATLLKKLEKKYSGKIGISFRNFPLSTSCNARLAHNLQPRSCEAALAALAAERQGKFWSYHDGLFESNLAGDERTLITIAETIGLDMAKWAADRNLPDLRKQLSDDIQIAGQIGINATPSVFINGHYVKNAHENVLDVLIQHEMEKLSK